MKSLFSTRLVALISPLLLAAALICPALQTLAADVQIFGVAKQQNFVQDSEQIVRLADDSDENPFEFDLFVDLAEGGAITSASVGTPGGTNIVLQTDGFDDGYYFSFKGEHLLNLNRQHPNGTYTFNIVTVNNGTINVPLNLTGDNYPGVPRVSNFTAAQSINAAADFTLAWDAFTGGTAGDYIEVFIEEDSDNYNEVFHSGPPGEGLNGTSTSILIPAGTLSAGKRYSVEIMFARIMQNVDSGGSLGVAAYTKRTHVLIATSGAVDTQAPNMFYSRPYYGEELVPVRSVIRFEFNEPMAQIVSINWTGTGLTPANFNYFWNHDDTVLSAVYNQAGGLPAGTQIGWTLNPAGGGSTMQDKAANALPMYSGNFTTSSDAATTGPDVAEIFLLKSQSFEQTTGGVFSQDNYEFEAFGDLNVMNGILNGSLTLPAPGSAVVYPENDFYGTTFDFSASYASKADLDRFFPNGSYALSLETAHDGTKNITLNFPADTYPNTPTLVDIGPLQTVDPSQPLTVTWGQFEGADDSGTFFIQLHISTSSGGDVYESPSEGEPGALTGTSISVTIPANTFSPGRNYEGELVFARIVAQDDSTYDGANFGAAFATVTKFEIQTTGTPIQPSLALVPGINPAQIDVTGDKHVNYVLEATQDFQSWFPVSYPERTYENTTTTLFDYDSSFFSRRFYRVKEVSDNNFQLPISLQGTVKNSQNFAVIAGATVSTSLDGNTAVTDSNGNFFLQTGVTSSESTQSYTVTVTRSGFNTFSQNANWGDRPRTLQIWLSPQ
jgi:hypothetical protein